MEIVIPGVITICASIEVLWAQCSTPCHIHVEVISVLTSTTVLAVLPIIDALAAIDFYL